MERSARQKINREIRELTDVLTQIILTDVYRTFQPNTKEYTFSDLMEPSLKLTTYLFTKQISIDTKKT